MSGDEIRHEMNMEQINREPSEKLHKWRVGWLMKKIIVCVGIFLTLFIAITFLMYKTESLFTYKSNWDVKHNGSIYSVECIILSNNNDITEKENLKYADIILSEVLKKSSIYIFYKKNVNGMVKVPKKYWGRLTKDGVKEVYLDNIFRN